MDKVYLIWDVEDGFQCDIAYSDKEMAQSSLEVIYSEAWIEEGKAQVREVMVV